MIYLDTAALVKLVRREAATDELVDWLNEQVDRIFISSALVEVELPRALHRTEPALLSSGPLSWLGFRCTTWTRLCAPPRVPIAIRGYGRRMRSTLRPQRRSWATI